MGEPLTPAGNGDGRDGRGRFGPGNRAGRGNPLNRKAQQLRSAMLRAITAKDVRAIIRKMGTLAQSGDVQAAKLVFDRTIGTSQPEDILQRLDALEQAVLMNQRAR